MAQATENEILGKSLKQWSGRLEETSQEAAVQGELFRSPEARDAGGMGKSCLVLC